MMEIIAFTPLAGSQGRVKAYLHAPITEMGTHRTQYPVVVLCPGGGYSMISQREDAPVALEYVSAGYNVFVLTYSVGENAADFTPLKELSATVMCIREKAAQWGCHPQQIAVCGFSAGGHLAGSLGTMWNDPAFINNFDTKGGQNRPNGIVLCYPVITAGEFAHVSSIQNVSGSAPGTVAYQYFSLENHVNGETSPAFLWHTADDGAVPVENTLLFAAALQKHKIPFECHIFPTGVHGSSICTQEVGTPHPYNRQWVQLSKNWLNQLFAYTT